MNPFTAMPKILLFGLYGAFGCLLSALLGEIFLAATYRPPEVRRAPQAVCLLLDCSGSMTEVVAGASQQKIDEMKQAASEFVIRRAPTEDLIAALGFETHVQSGAPLTDDAGRLRSAIASFDGRGETNMEEGLNAARRQLQGSPLPRHILLFTDGQPTSDRGATLAAGRACLDEGITIVAIATGDADVQFLEELVGEPPNVDAGPIDLVFFANEGEFDRAFQEAEEVIQLRSVVEVEASGGSLPYRVFRLGVWTSFLAIGLSLALIGGQNLYLKRRPLTARNSLMGVVGGLAAGIVAGAVGEVVFYAAQEAPGAWVILGRVAAWTLLGALFGAGISYFVPNLKRSRAVLGGAIGGAGGAVGFFIAARLLGDLSARLVGAEILGLFLGLMIALTDAVSRRAWIDVVYGKGESRRVSLGRERVSVGSGDATVYVPKGPDVAYRYWLDRGEIYCQDVVAGDTAKVEPGDRRTIGPIEVVVGARAAKTDEALLLVLSSGARIRLSAGTRLTTSDIPQLHPRGSDDTVAKVERHPKHESVLGLMNLTTNSWTATTEAGNVRTIEPEKRIRIADGTKIDFGAATAKIVST